MQLLADKCIELNIVEKTSADTVRNVLKTNLNLTSKVLADTVETPALPSGARSGGCVNRFSQSETPPPLEPRRR